MSDIYQHIASKMNEMSKSQTKIAQYILNNQTNVPFFTVSTLAKQSNVSEATVIRFVTFLGFSGYPQFQEELRKAMRRHLSTFERLEITQNTFTEGAKATIHDVFHKDCENLQATEEKLDLETFEQAAEAISKAPRIFICSNRSAFSLGYFLGYYLDMILGNVTFIHSINANLIQLDSLTENDAVIGISFPRYATDTSKAFHYAYESGSTTIAITDCLFSPLIPDARHALLTVTQTPAFFDSYVSALSLINALLIQIVRIHPHVEDRLKHFEALWAQYHAFMEGNGESIERS